MAAETVEVLETPPVVGAGAVEEGIEVGVEEGPIESVEPMVNATTDAASRPVVHANSPQPLEDPKVTAFYIEANSLLRLKDYDQLSTILELWIQTHPEDRRADSLLLTSRINQNEDLLRSVLKEESDLHNTLIDPEYLAAKTITDPYIARQLNVVEALIGNEKHTDALRYLNEVLLTDKNNQAALLMKDRLVASMLKIERRHLDRERKNQRERSINDIIKRGSIPDEKASIPRVYRIFPEDLNEEDRTQLMAKLRVPLMGFNYKGATLASVLDNLFAIAGLNYIIYDQALGDETLTLSLRDETIESVLYTIQRMVGVRFNYHGGSVYVTSVDNPILVTEVVRLRSGLTNVQAAPALVAVGAAGGSARNGVGGAGGSAGGAAAGLGQQSPQAAGGAAAGDDLSDIELFLDSVRNEELTEWPDGSNIFLDKKSSTIMIRSSPSTISDFKRLLRAIDYVSEQILIEARFVEVRDGALKNIGVSWTLLANEASTSSDRLTIGGVSSGATVNPLTDFSNPANQLSLGETISGNTGFFAGIVGQGADMMPNFASQISALEEKGDANSLSEPKILTLSNMTGVIDIRTDITYVADIDNRALPTTVNNNDGGTSLNGANFAGVPQLETDYEGINLTVTPSVATNGDVITLKITPVVRELIQLRRVPFIVPGAGDQGLFVERPEFTTRQISTTLHIRNGETIVLGGLIRERDQNDRSGIPGLSRVPFVGGLFRNTQKTNQRSKLLILVTATIIDPTGASYDEQVRHITNTANVVLPPEIQEIKAAQNKEARDQESANIILDEIDPKRKKAHKRGGRR